MRHGPCPWSARLPRRRAAKAARRGASQAREVCRIEYAAALEESLRELEQLLELLRQLAHSGAADALARIAQLLDAR